jgi:hypothetical protein
MAVESPLELLLRAILSLVLLLSDQIRMPGRLYLLSGHIMPSGSEFEPNYDKPNANRALASTRSRFWISAAIFRDIEGSRPRGRAIVLW